MAQNVFRVKVFKVGESDVPAPEVYRMSGWGNWETLHFHMIMAYNDETNFLINTGMPVDMEERNRAMVEFAGSRAKFTSSDSIETLRKAGFKPEDVKNISFTPLQDYTTGRADEFKNATYHILKKGWINDIMVPGPHNDNRNLFIPENVLQYLLFEAKDRIHFFDAENITELIPGISALWVGCHHRASLAFIINTGKGKIIFTDASFKSSNILKSIPMGIAENIFECYSAYDKLKSYVNVLSAYDPDIDGLEF